MALYTMLHRLFVTRYLRQIYVPSFFPRILNSQMKSPFLTRKWSFLINFENANNEVRLYIIQSCVPIYLYSSSIAHFLLSFSYLCSYLSSLLILSFRCTCPAFPFNVLFALFPFSALTKFCCHGQITNYILRILVDFRVKLLKLKWFDLIFC